MYGYFQSSEDCDGHGFCQILLGHQTDAKQLLKKDNVMNFQRRMTFEIKIKIRCVTFDSNSSIAGDNSQRNPEYHLISSTRSHI